MAQAHDVFAHLGTPNAATYRAVLGAFGAARRRFAMHLRPRDVDDLVRRETGAGVEEAALGAALTQLVEWGNLRPHPDTGRVTSPEDFYRARYLYQLTAAGEACERALAVFDEALGRRGALQSVALADVAAHLRSLLDLAAADEPDPAKVHAALESLTSRLRALAENAEAFMGSLQRSIDLQDVDVEAFVAYKNRLVEYLERFIGDLQSTGAEIARLVLDLDGAPVQRLVDLAVERETADLAPDTSPAVAAGPDGPGGDAGAQAGGSSAAVAAPLHPELAEAALAHQVDLLRATWAERWDGVRGWFVSTPGRQSQAGVLRSQARSAVPSLLQVVATLNERRQGRSDRAADFRALAVRFAAADDDAARHRLWHSAFGMSSVRHLSVDADTLEQRDADPVPPSTAWRDAPPLLISPQLRRTGSWERRGKPSAVRDRSEERRVLAARHAAEAEQTARAREQLLSDGPRRLSELPELDADAFELFLALLGTALAASRRGGGRTVTSTSDGSLVIELEPLPGHDRQPGRADAEPPWVVVRTPAGDLCGPDHLLWVRDARSEPVALSGAAS